MADRDRDEAAAQVVPAGTLVGYVGSTGNSTGPRLSLSAAFERKKQPPRPQVRATIPLSMAGVLGQRQEQENDDE